MFHFFHTTKDATNLYVTLIAGDGAHVGQFNAGATFYTLAGISSSHWRAGVINLTDAGGLGIYPWTPKSGTPDGYYAVAVWQSSGGPGTELPGDTFVGAAAPADIVSLLPVRIPTAGEVVAAMGARSLNAPAAGTWDEALALAWARACNEVIASDTITYKDPSDSTIRTVTLSPPGGPYNQKAP